MDIFRADVNEKTKISAISFVKYPAILYNFDFKQEYIIDRLNSMVLVDNYLTSPILIPDQYIYRGDFFIYYSKQDIIQIANKLIKNVNDLKFNIEHDPSKEVRYIHLIGLYLLDGVNHSSNYNLPIGTLFVQLLINNDDLIEEIKNKKIEGLSIEGVVGIKKDESTFRIDNKFQIKSNKYNSNSKNDSKK